MKKQKGIALLIVVLVIALLLIMGGALVRLALSNSRAAVTQLNGIKAFYLAEAGIEKAKCEMAKDCGWHTDLPHSPPDDLLWLMEGGGAQGHASPLGEPLGEGHFKIVKEQGKNLIYSIGYLGSDIEKSKARSIIRIEYSCPPFRDLEWRLL